MPETLASTPPPNAPLKASPPQSIFAANLALLTEFAGLWVGAGFNVMSLPDFDSAPPSTGPKHFRLKLNATTEVLQFIPIGGPVPNRGALTDLGNNTGQSDINLFGLTYLQRVSDAPTHGAMHVEPGIWAGVPPTTIPPAPNDTYVRMGTVPHGNSLLAQSTFATTINGGPQIADNSSLPTGPGVTPGYLTVFNNPPLPLPPGMLPSYVKNPNQALKDSIAGQTITKTVVMTISTQPAGGIVNIPFVVSNANATQLDAIFWIETVQQPGGGSFMQLQYTQTVILNFLGIDWPHVSVATLIKR